MRITERYNHFIPCKGTVLDVRADQWNKLAISKVPSYVCIICNGIFYLQS